MKRTLLFALVLINAVVQAQWVNLGDKIDGTNQSDLSGREIALSPNGKVMATGLYQSFSGDPDKGRVEIYSFDGINWNKLGNTIEGDALGDAFGFSIDLSNDGHTIIIGAPSNYSGYAKIYKLNSNSWELSGSISGDNEDDFFGGSVSISDDGNTIAIGAPQIYSGANGYAKTFRLDGPNWNLLGDKIQGSSAGDKFGNEVSISGDGKTLAIGAPSNDEAGHTTGQATMYSLNASIWEVKGNKINGNGEYDETGNAISLSYDGNIVALGIALNNEFGTDAGKVCVYQYNSGNWSSFGAPILGDEREAEFGYSVGIDSAGNTIAIGARANSQNGVNTGSVSTYEYETSNWIHKGDNILGSPSSGEQFGYSISINNNGNILAVGAPFSDGENGDYYTGTVKVFKWVSPSKITSNNTPSTACLVFPNPTEDYISIKSSAKIKAIEIIGTNGIQLQPKTNATRISLANLPTGVYIVKVSTQYGMSTHKISKK